MAVIDPVDGSTNAHRGMPFYATSICVLDAQGPLVGLVVNQATGTRFEAVRGGGARRDGEAIAPSGCTDLSSAIVGISGFPGDAPGLGPVPRPGRGRPRVLRSGRGGARCVFGRGAGARSSAGTIWPACSSAARVGAVTVDRDGADVVVRDGGTRRPLVAATPLLAEQLLAKDEL